MQAEMPSGGTYRRVPLAPHQRVDRITPTESCFVLAHMGVPRVAAEGGRSASRGWCATRSPHLAALKAMPQTEIESFHQCAGAPKRADLPMRRVMNVVWGGIRLRRHPLSRRRVARRAVHLVLRARPRHL